MPCYTSLPSVLTTRTVCRTIRPAAARLTGTRSAHDDPSGRQTTPSIRLVSPRPSKKELIHVYKKRKALQRLESAINPTDLTATLEAHRDSNRSSIIRKIPGTHTDPDVFRPTILEQSPLERPTEDHDSEAKAAERLGGSKREDSEDTPKIIEPERQFGQPHSTITTYSAKGVAQGSFLATHQELPVRTSISKAEAGEQNGHVMKEIRRKVLRTSEGLPKSATPESESQEEVDAHNGHPMEAQRRRVLRASERPREPMSSERTRSSYFDSIRRVRRVIQNKQKAANTRGMLRNVPVDLLEYTGSQVPLQPATIDPSFPEPWARTPTTEGYTPKQQLELEMELFAHWMEPTPAEEAAREAVFQLALQIVHEAAPEMQAEKFGSQTTGLAMPTSDIDIRLFPSDLDLDLQEEQPTHRSKNSPEANKFRASIDTIHTTLLAHPDFTLVTKHAGHRFPLLAATHIHTGLALQLVATKDTSPSREIIKSYLATTPTLKPLYMLVRTILDMRNLSNVWTGGLGSYTIFMLVAASQTHNKKNINPNPNHLTQNQNQNQNQTCPLADQLLTFLTFTANLNTYTTGLSVQPPRTFKKKSVPSITENTIAKYDFVLKGQHRIQHPQFYQRYLLCLQDPADPFNDLGRKGYAIKDIQTTFRGLLDELLVRLGEGGGGGEKERRKMGRMTTSKKPILRGLVGRCDQLYDENRIKMDIFGEELMEARQEEEEM